MSWKFYSGLIFVVASVVLGFFHWLVFGNSRDLMFYLAVDLVFVPIQVLLVSVIFEKLMREHEKESLVKKLNMVIGAFFSEVGADLLRMIDSFCANAGELENVCGVSAAWSDREFKDAKKLTSSSQYDLKPSIENLKAMKTFLLDKRLFVLSLLQNPNLLEHDTFSNLLWAVTHLTEELEARGDLDSLPKSDIDHLAGDVKRAFGLLIAEWLAYMGHLKTDYPFIFSLAVRNSPFNRHPDPIIKG